MVLPEAIQAHCEGIIREFHPEKVILFGSYAYGQPDADSDVDLLVRDPETLSQRLSLGDPFLHEVMGRGCVLYAAS